MASAAVALVGELSVLKSGGTGVSDWAGLLGARTLDESPVPSCSSPPPSSAAAAMEEQTAHSEASRKWVKQPGVLSHALHSAALPCA